MGPPRRCRLPAIVLGLALAAPAVAAPPQVVATIAPLHSLVAGVAGERAAPRLLVPGGRSPHTYALAPSDARALASADLVFSAGEVAEAFLRRPLAALAGDARIVRMAALEGVRRLAARRGGTWSDRGHDDGHAHADARLDPHVWLDPHNAAVFTRAVATALADVDPANAAHYRDNAATLRTRLEALDRELAAALAPVAGTPYLVFHDAYQYLEARYGLAAAGAVTVAPGRSPGARRLHELRTRIEHEGIACLFTEPQFPPQLARTIVEGTGARVATLDPLGAGLEPGPGLYFELMRRLAEDLRGCLAPAAGATGG